MVVFDELAEALESALSVVPQAAMESNMAALSARAAMDLNFTAIIVFFFLSFFCLLFFYRTFIASRSNESPVSQMGTIRQ